MTKLTIEEKINDLYLTSKKDAVDRFKILQDVKDSANEVFTVMIKMANDITLLRQRIEKLEQGMLTHESSTGTDSSY